MREYTVVDQRRPKDHSFTLVVTETLYVTLDG